MGHYQKGDGKGNGKKYMRKRNGKVTRIREGYEVKRRIFFFFFFCKVECVTGSSLRETSAFVWLIRDREVEENVMNYSCRNNEENQLILGIAFTRG